MTSPGVRSPSTPQAPPSPHDPILEEVKRFYDEHHDAVERIRRARRYFYESLGRTVAAHVPAGRRVLDIGCGSGHLLAALQPSYGVGIDVSGRAIAAARRSYDGPALRFLEGDGGDHRVLAAAGGPFDVVMLVNVITHLTDVEATLAALHSVCSPTTRILIYSYSRLWQPVFWLAERLRLKHRQPAEAWLPPEEVRHMLRLADFEVVRRELRILCPVRVPLVADVLNRYVGRLPVLEWASMMYGIVARPARWTARGASGPPVRVSVVIPCRNEAGHLPLLVPRLPDLGPGSEFLLVEGNSTDDTEAVARRLVQENPDRPLRFLKQAGRGKGDAVRQGFAEARGDVLAILDADMGVAPEDLPKFVAALAQGKGELINGSRLVYPMESRAMPFLNLVANKLFAWLFSWLLGQQVRDTLCGTKVLRRDTYERITANRAAFGDFDPFGDFDLLFGAARLDLRIIDLAVRYHERVYGETNISRFRHGWLLLRMSLFAARKLKFG